MLSLMPRKKERTALAGRARNPFELLRREFASLLDTPMWPWGSWEGEPWGFETEERENETVLRAEVPAAVWQDAAASPLARVKANLSQ